MASLKEAMSQVGLMTPADCKPTAPFTVKPFPKDGVIRGWEHPKLDGFRATLVWDGTVLTAQSKTGKLDYAHHLTHLTDVLTHFHTPAFTTECELYTGKGGTLSFNVTSSILRKKEASKLSKAVKIHLLYPSYEVISVFKALNPEDVPFLSQTHEYPHAEQDWNEAKLTAAYHLHQMQISDIEGLVIETLEGTYYKWLPENEMDCTVFGFTQGDGKFQLGIGSLIVVDADGVQHTVGSGLTAEQRFTSFSELKGKTVTVKYKHKLETGALRHPRLQFKELV